jgi:hypothetical protein
MKKFTKINESKTNPWYKKGELIVKFKDGQQISNEVVTFLLKKLGLDYKRSDKKSRPEYVKITPSLELDCYIIKVPVGKEEETIKLLEKEFGDEIDWVERRDIKFELRSYFAAYVSETITNISEESQISDDEWKIGIENVIDILNLLKDDKYDEIRKEYETDYQVRDKFKNID